MRVLIIGAGAVGFYLARRLSDQAQEVAIVDPDPAKIQHAADNLDVLAVQGNGAAPPTLEAAGLAKTDILVAASGVDEVNLLACLAASRQDVKVKVARVRHPEHFAPGSLLSLQDLGVDLVISPEQECAWEIFQLLATPAATDLARFAEGRVQLMGLRVRPGAPVEGRSLAAFDQEVGDRRFVVAAVVRDGETEIPTGDTVLRADDKIFLLAPSGQTRKLPALAGHDTHEVRRVIIAGGSDEAVYLAQHLSQHRISSTIVEQSRRRARELAELLPESLILRGDATDLELLQMEGVEGVDGFVALTDRDEVNMLVALLAKSLGADRVIPLVHRAEYMGLVDRVGLDAAVSPRITAANAIFRHLRGGSVTSVATVKGSRAEALEAIVSAHAPIAGRKVRDIRFPPGALLGVLVRGDEVIMPRGDETIREGDRAIFFLLPDALEALGKLIR